MAVLITDYDTVVAVETAANGTNGTREAGVVTAVADAFNGENVTTEIRNADNTLLGSFVNGTFTANTLTDPKTIALGPQVSWSFSSEGIPERAIFKNNLGQAILECSAGLNNTDIDFLAPIEENVPVNLRNVAFQANTSLDTSSTPTPGRMLISDASMDALVAKAQANHADWVALKNWCNTNLNYVSVSTFAGSYEHYFIGNYAFAYMIGSRIGDPNADTWAAECLRIYNLEPRFTHANSVNTFIGMRYLTPGALSATFTNAPTGTFSKGDTLVGTSSGATAELLTITSAATGSNALAIKNKVGNFVAGERVEVQNRPSSFFLWGALIRPLILADSGYGSRYFGLTYAFLLDWLDGYSGLTQTIKNEMYELIKAYWDQCAGTNITGYSAYNWPNNIGNYTAGHTIFKVCSGILLKDVYPEYYDTAVAEFKTVATFFRDVVRNSGIMPEGTKNYSTGMVSAYAECLLAFKTKTTEDMSPYMSFFENCAPAYYLMLNNGGNFSMDDGFVDSWPVIFASSTLAVLQELFGKGSYQSKCVAAIFAKRVPSFYAGTQPTVFYWKKFAYHKADETFTDAELPKAMGNTYLLVKSDNTSNGTSVWMSSGPYYNNILYQRTDQGSLRISRNMPLLVTSEYNLKGLWYGVYPTQVHQNYCTVHGRTQDSNIQQYHYNIGMQETSSSVKFPTNFLNTNSEYGLSHYQNETSWCFGRVPYRTAYFTNPQQTTGPFINRIARSVLFVRPGLVFVFDAFTQDASEPNSYIKTHWQFPLEAGSPVTSNSNRDIQVTYSPSKLWGHASYPTTYGENTVAEFDGRWRNTYKWSYTPPSITNKQFFLTVFRAGDVTGFSDPSYTDFTDTNVYGCLVSNLTSSEGTQVCGIYVDNGTDTVPTSISYSVAQTGSCMHYIAGLKPNTSYTVTESLVAGTASVSVVEGAGVTAGSGGVLSFEVA